MCTFCISFVKLCVTALVILSQLLVACSTDGPSPPQTPEEELATIQIEEGLQVQLVASEPMVEDPVFSTFDEDGRLWVVEMRGFMPDVDGNGEDQRIGRVSILQDTTGDGIMDKSTVYLDGLIMPRALAVVKGGALVVEDQKLWMTTDDNKDLIADSKTLVDSLYGGPPLPEHSPNGLWRGLDNWYYNAKSSLRYKQVDGQWTRDSTEFRGQWGLSHDDEGRLFYNYNWSQLHADLVPPNYLSRNPHHKPTTGIDHGVTIDRRVYPIRPNPAVNRGYIPGTLDEQGRLLEFTAACSPFVYRGRALPKEYYGNAFVAEPSGNLVKRNVVVENQAVLSAYDPHPGREFMASTDERFRPVSITSGPDGALYITDMYRGLVQHERYVTPYLREQTLKRKLEQPSHYGRIWRVVPVNWKQPAQKKLSQAGSELVTLLGDDNGWTRDIAQRLLVETYDEANALEIISLMSASNALFKLHALWTLNGLGVLPTDILFASLNDESDAVANAALRILERQATDEEVRERLGRILISKTADVNYKRRLQYVLSSYRLKTSHRAQLVDAAISKYPDSVLMRDAVMSVTADEEVALLNRLRTNASWKEPSPGKEIFIEMLATAIAQSRNGEDILNVLALPKQEWISTSAIFGITSAGMNNPAISLPDEPQIIHNLGTDSVVVAKLAQMFDWPGHKADTSAAVKGLLNDKDQARFAQGRKLYLTSCASCHGNNGAGMNHLAPTLIGSDWVLGNERRLALLVLHGLEGPIEVAGKVYDVPEILPVMPSHSTMDDGAITSILTYIRNEWGNDAGPVNQRTVGRTRHTTQGRVMPWTAKELNEHMADSLAVNNE